MDIRYMDVESAKLAVELQLEDINDLINGLYDDPPKDNELEGFEVMKSDLYVQLQALEGQILALNILKGEHMSRLTFKKLLDEEKQAIGDHQLAMDCEGYEVSDSEVQSCAEYEASLCDDDDEYDSDEDQWQLAKDLYSAEMDPGNKNRAPQHGIRTVNAQEVRGVGKARVAMPQMRRRCNACLEHVRVVDTLTLRCQPEWHVYCRNCLVDLFKTAIVDTTLFPPRCCKITLPLDTCRALLPKELVKEFDLKVEELATPNPTYCFDCAKFIRLQDVHHDIGNCVFCGNKTCAVCKGKQHDGLCPEDPHVKLLLDAAKRSNWQQCTRCKNMVELAQGCYHMNCRCNYQFCYLCGLQWKTCVCPNWEERNLVVEPLDDEPAVQAAPLQPGLVEDAEDEDSEDEDSEDEDSEDEDEDEDEECAHPTRYRVRGPPCEDCGHSLAFVMECNVCGHQSCWRCINNRA